MRWLCFMLYFLLWSAVVLAQEENQKTPSQDQNQNQTQEQTETPTTSPYNSILDNLNLIPNAKTVSQLLQRNYLTDMNKILSECVSKKEGISPKTFFVPTDEAIQRTIAQHKNVTGTEEIKELENTENGRNYLRALVYLHIVNGTYTPERAANATIIPTLLDYAPYSMMENSSQVLVTSNNPQKLPTIYQERNVTDVHSFDFQENQENQNQGGTEAQKNLSIVSVYHTKNGLSLANLTGESFNCSNGIIHMIDNVIPVPPNITQQLNNANLTTFQALAKVTGLSKIIKSKSRITVFAPTNSAFEEFCTRLQGIADASAKSHGMNSTKVLFAGYSNWAVQNDANQYGSSRSPVTRMSQGSGELQSFSLLGPIYHLYTKGDQTMEEDTRITESENATFSQFAKLGLTKDDLQTLLAAHIIDDQVLYSTNVTKEVGATTIDGDSVILSPTSDNSSFSVSLQPNVTTRGGKQLAKLRQSDQQNSYQSNSTAIYQNVLMTNGVMHIMNNLTMVPGLMNNITQKLEQASQRNYNVLQYCDSTLSRSDEGQQQQHSEYFTDSSMNSGLQLDEESNCGEHQRICWVQTELNKLCENAYKEGSQNFVEELSKRKPKAMCYNPETHVCVNSTTLCPIDSPEQCSGQCFNLERYTCSNHFFLCDRKNPLRCGDACYSPNYYDCKDNQLINKGNTTAA